MPRSIGSISTIIGVQTPVAPPVLLLEWHLPSGTQRFSSAGAAMTPSGGWRPNGILQIPNLVTAVIDGEDVHFQDIQIQFENLADDASSNWFITALDAGQVFEDTLGIFYLYSGTTGDQIEIWRGTAKRPEFDPQNFTATVSFTYIFTSFNIPFPSKTTDQVYFNNADSLLSRGSDKSTQLSPVPLMFGAGSTKVRPTIVYGSIDSNNVLNVNAVVSGINPSLPFQPTDISAAGMKINQITPATTEVFKVGTEVTADPNLSQFPDGQVHPNVAFFYASFQLATQQQQDLSSIDPDEIKMDLANGRPLARTGLPSGNHAYILEDILRDANFCIGRPAAEFDATVLIDTANYVGTRYQCWLEASEQKPLIDWMQAIMFDANLYMVNVNGLYQIRAYRNDETPSIAFASGDSGHSGRQIDGNRLNRVWEETLSDTYNQLLFSYRKSNRHPRAVKVYDPNAQNYSGYRKVNENSRTAAGIRDEEQAKICAAIHLRNKLNGNLYIDFSVPIWDGLDVAPGDLITVWSPDIWNNSVNNTFRVQTQTFNFGDNPTVQFVCQVYNAAIFSDSYTGLGVDILRGSDNVSTEARPPDVTPVSLVISQPPGTTDDSLGQLMQLTTTWTYPFVDLTALATAGAYAEYPIAFVQMWGHYSDESIYEAVMVKEVQYPATTASFLIDYHKNRNYEVFFVALNNGRGRGPLGLIPDLTHVTYLTANLSATGASASVGGVTGFSANGYVVCEREMMKLTATVPSGTTLNFITSGANRAPQFGTTAIAHPTGTQIAPAKQSYPSMTIALTAPRFIFPNVASFVARARPDGVRCKWPPVNASNKNQYHLYWSTDSDAGTNAAKLGVAAPTWYTTDPESPPAGINLELVSDHSFLVLWEDIGAIGTYIYARVGAFNHKRAYSAQLSALGTNAPAASGGVSPPTDGPSTPASGDVVVNTAKVGLGGGMADCVFTVYADVTRTKSFATTGTTQLVLFLTNSRSKVEKYTYDITDTSVTNVQIPLVLNLAAPYTWTQTRAWNLGGKADSLTASVAIFAGNFATNAALITSIGITITPINENHSYEDVSFTQPNPPVLLVYAILAHKLPGEGVYSETKRRDLIGGTGVLTSGAVSFRTKIPHPKKAALNSQVTLVSVDGTSITFTKGTTDTSIDVDTAAPNNGTAITITRLQLKHGRSIICEFVLPTLQMASYDHTSFIIHDNGALGTRRYFDPATGLWGTTLVELQFAQGSVPSIPAAKSDLAAGGRTTIYCKVGIYNLYNGGSSTFSSDTGNSFSVSGTSGGTEPGPGDNAIPTGLATPVLNFVAKTGVVVDGMTVSTDFNQPAYKYIVLKDPIAGTYFDLPYYMSRGGFIDFTTATGSARAASSEGAARYLIDGDAVLKQLGIRRSDLVFVFGASGSLCAYFYAANQQFGLNSTPSAVSNTLAIPNLKDNLNPRDVSQIVDVGITLETPSQLLVNSDFLGAVDNASNNTALMGWGATSLLSNIANPVSPNVRGITTASTTRMSWDQSNHIVRVWDPTFYLVGIEEIVSGTIDGPIPQHHCPPGERMSVLVQLRAPTGGVSGTLYIYICASDGTKLVGTNPATGHQAAEIVLTGNIAPYPGAPSPDISSTFAIFGGKFDLLSTWIAGDKVIVFDFSATSGISTSHSLDICRPILVRGNTFKAHHPRAKLESVIIPSIMTPVPAPVGDLGDPTYSARGGGVAAGAGGAIVPISSL